MPNAHYRCNVIVQGYAPRFLTLCMYISSLLTSCTVASFCILLLAHCEHLYCTPNPFPLFAECSTGIEVPDPPLQQINELNIGSKLTKCVTIRTEIASNRGCSKPVDKWMQYMKYVKPDNIQCLSISKPSDWKCNNDDHVLLHIDIPNQQVYPLSMLVTPFRCVYLIAFDLPNGEEEVKKTIKRIHNALKDVYAYSSCKMPGLHDELQANPRVFLIGLQREGNDKDAFSQELRQMLSSRSYERLLEVPKEFPKGHNPPYWTIRAAELSIHKNASLLKQILCYSCPLPQIFYQFLASYCKLHQMFTDSPFVRYEDVEAKMANLGVVERTEFKQFLTVLHCFGCVFYRPFSNMTKTFVVLQPQYLSQIFAEVQRLSKDWELMTIADLFSSTTAPIQPEMQEWFQTVCMSMGLVIVQPFGFRPEYVFVMGLKPECNPPEREHFSVDPLLVSYSPLDIVQRDDGFLPSSLFPTFVSAFLEKLKLHCSTKRQMVKVKDMKRHYLLVSVQASRRIHVVERDSFIEIGLQQFVGTQRLPEEDQCKQLQLFCKDIFKLISASAECAVERLTLNKLSIQYGFYIRRSEDSGAECSFGEYDPNDRMIDLQDSTLQQQIWFHDIGYSKVCYAIVFCMLN